MSSMRPSDGSKNEGMDEGGGRQGGRVQAAGLSVRRALGVFPAMVRLLTLSLWAISPSDPLRALCHSEVFTISSWFVSCISVLYIRPPTEGKMKLPDRSVYVANDNS